MAQYSVQLVLDHFYVGFGVEAESAEQALAICESIAMEEGLPEYVITRCDPVVEVL